jgi:hypothetical protein
MLISIDNVQAAYNAVSGSDTNMQPAGHHKYSASVACVGYVSLFSSF